LKIDLSQKSQREAALSFGCPLKRWVSLTL
jgi:hypothetical protein